MVLTTLQEHPWLRPEEQKAFDLKKA